MKKQFTVKNPQGIHARPAGAIAKKATEFANEQITIEFNERKVNAKSITLLLTLGMKPGDMVTVSAEGNKAVEAIEAVGIVIESIFD